MGPLKYISLKMVIRKLSSVVAVSDRSPQYYRYPSRLYFPCQTSSFSIIGLFSRINIESSLAFDIPKSADSVQVCGGTTVCLLCSQGLCAKVRDDALSIHIKRSSSPPRFFQKLPKLPNGHIAANTPKPQGELLGTRTTCQLFSSILLLPSSPWLQMGPF